MAQIVTKVSDLRRDENAGDIISIHDDDVELSGPGYADCKVLKVANVTADQLRRKLAAQDIRDNEDGTREWNDRGTWRKIQRRTKHSHNANDLTSEDIKKLADPKTDKRALWGKIVTPNTRDPLNQEPK